MANGQPKVNTYLGMTAPISLAGPDRADTERTQALVKALEPHGCFESEDELTHRMEVLASLNGLIKTWIKEISLEKNMPIEVAETVGGHVYTFGSYRLGTVKNICEKAKMLVQNFKGSNNTFKQKAGPRLI